MSTRWLRLLAAAGSAARARRATNTPRRWPSWRRTSKRWGP